MKLCFSKVRFVKSATKKEEFLFDKPVFTFIGRSNVGKSTLINRLVQQKGFRKTSKTAGRTNRVNYALIDEKIYLADVPATVLQPLNAIVSPRGGNPSWKKIEL